MSETPFLVEWTITISRNGDVTNDAVTFGNSFADVYKGFVAIRAELDRQIAERRNCPYNPKYRSTDPMFAK